MPNILVRVPKGVFDPVAREKLAASLTSAAHVVEQIGDDPAHGIFTWIEIQEFEPQAFYVGGRQVIEFVIPVVVQFQYPDGVLTDASREDAARLFQDAIEACKPVSDARPLRTSVIMSPVLDGHWGGSGKIWRLADLAQAAGYKHLQHLVKA